MSDWIEWTGGENPVPGKMVDIRMRCGDLASAPSKDWEWPHHDSYGDIIAYRLASPPADQPAKETCFGLSGIALMGGLEDQPADHIGEVDLAELKRLAEATTSGPWLYDRDGDEGSVWTRQPHTGELARTAPEDINGDFPAYANAAFIAAANPATVLSLLSLIARQQETMRADGAALERCSAALQRLHTDIEALMADSEGVAGLHHNGDVATWEELGEGGQFSDWLGDPMWAARNAWSDARARLSARQGGGS